MKTMDNQQWEIDNRMKWINKKIFAICSLLVFSFSLSTAQVNPSPQYPWVKVQTAKVPTTNVADFNDPQKATTSIQYYDASGKILQTINSGVSPTGNDIISSVVSLDAFGRTDKSYLPVSSGTSSGQYLLNVETTAQTFYNDTKPFAKVAQYEASPMSRILKSFKPGEAFQSTGSQGMQQNYEVAGAGIRRYILTSENTIDGTGFYTDGKLVKTYSKDEDGNEVIEYRGAQSGRLIQTHVKDRILSNLLITAYVYDNIGRIRFIIPPKSYNATTNISVETHSDGLYIYRYDDQSRLVETQKPGAGAEYTIYNLLGQPVLTQNALQRESNLWLWVKYDGHGRTVMSGTLTTSYSRSQLQTYFDDYKVSDRFEEPSIGSGSLLGYTKRSFPPPIASITENNVEIVNYYDNYTWVNNPSLSFISYQTRWPNAKGLATGNMVKRLDTGVWMKSVWYYDDQNRLIQTQTLNRFGTVNQTDIFFDFEGKLQEERTIYRYPGQSDITIQKLYGYDNAGRKVYAKHKVNGIETPIAKYNYDEIGRLESKYFGVTEGRDIIIENSPQPDRDTDIAYRYVELQPGTITAENGTYIASISRGPLQKVNYSYTINGQLRGINLNPAGDIPTASQMAEDGDVFAMKLDHHETGQTYNGKLAKQTWATRSPAAGQTQPRSFTYGYDGFDRINSAAYAGVGNEDYGMPGIDYDANGNITAFNRRGLNSPGNWQSIDILSFNYQNTVSNKLSYIVDYGNANVGFKDSGGFGTDYTYYPDGSLKSDANKGITLIEYNFLGLEEKIHFGSTKRIENIYDAEGVKLEQRLINGSATHTTEYIGSLIYFNGVMQTIIHDEGRVKVDGTNYRYQFFIGDFRGDTRIIVERLNDTTALVQETHLGLFGEPLNGIGKEGDWKKLYQGKEYIDFEGYNVYDFQARSYDPWMGRFNSIDPIDSYGLSGYSAMNNNPLSYIDPDGRSPLLLAIGIGALIGGHINGSIKGMRGGNYFDGFWRGALTGAVGGALGFYAPIGIGPGLAYGAGSGAITGGLGAGLNGGNIGKGMLYGGIGGGISGGISGGMGASKLGANVWSGKRAPHSMYYNNDIFTASFDENRLEYSDNSLKDFKQQHFPDVKTNHNLSIKTPNGFTADNNYFYDAKGGKVIGVTASRVWKGGSAGTIHFANKAFYSPETMFLTMGHELGHSLMNVLPGAAPLQWEQHQSIYDWELKAAVANQWRKYEFNFLSNYPLPFMFKDKRFEDVIRSFPLKINLR